MEFSKYKQWQMIPDPQTVFCILFLLLFWFLSKKGSVWSISAFQLHKYIYSPVASSFLIFEGVWGWISKHFWCIRYKIKKIWISSNLISSHSHLFIWISSFFVQSSILKNYHIKEVGREGLVLQQYMFLQFEVVFSKSKQLT